MCDDVEKALYETYDKLKKANVFQYLTEFYERIILLYIKRFGNKQYAETIPTEEFILQLEDCANHVCDNFKNCHDMFYTLDELERSLIIAALIHILLDNKN